MRYQNWDVLMFPGSSRVPIQEFDTKCYGLEQNPGFSTVLPAIDTDRNSFESMTVVPVLTSFVASLERGAAFRVSIHCWDKPKPSNLLLNYKTPDESVLFRARVYIDGVLAAHRTFEGGTWPEVIANVLEHGDQRLRFPAFHKEILQQPHWEPGESLGRVKVIISEGVLRDITPPAPADTMFDRLRDVVVFSFQHAPQNILEFSNIAWPNTKIFARLSKRVPRPGPIGSRLPPVSGHEAHSHSPLRPAAAIRGGKPLSSGLDGFQRLLNAQTFSDLQSDPVSKASTFPLSDKESPERRELVGGTVTCEDPFICPQPISSQQWRLQLRSTSHDLPMPDYTSNKTETSGGCTEMSGVSFPRANFLRHMNEANPQEIVQALSPARQEELLQVLSASHSPVRGTHAPTNTPRSLSDQSRPQSPLIKDGAGTRQMIRLDGPPGRRDPSDSYWPLRLQKREQRRRTYSDSSIRSTSGPVKESIKHDISPVLPREWAGKDGSGPLVPIGMKSLSMNAQRQRSTSNASKRKRGPASPSVGIGKTQDPIHVVIDSSTSGAGLEAGLKHNTPTRIVVALNDELREPWKKYRKFKPLDLPNRQWPSKTNEKPPRWLATDLRDGNQSLPDPMDGEQKLRFFKMLVELGYKEIEVSFPSASQTDYDFTRSLVETPGVVPDDVWLQVLSPCREDLIRRTVESLRGAKKAILHLYLATSDCFRRIVFGMTEDESIALAVKCTKLARSLTKDDPSQAGTEWLYEFSPETFSDTSPEFAVRICEAVKEAWGPTEDAKLIFNLPATVEMSTPNVFADQVEYFSTHMTEREKFCISVHPHNDRGCAVAAAELAQMAGAERVEGTLFGNGERTGNVDLVTLALNLYTQGIWPNVDFSDIGKVIRVCEESTKIPVNERWPYGGQLVVCAFSGSHQDAIKKGFQVRKNKGLGQQDPWEVPYLPLDPQDLGRTYEAVIRVNSQSGKGGVAWIIQRSLELDLPRGLQVAFSKIVQKEADAKGRELLPREIQALFEESYHLKKNPRFTLVDYNITAVRTTSPAPTMKSSVGQPPQTAAPAQNTSTAKRQFAGIIAIDGIQHPVVGVGNGAISSLANALHSLGIDLDVADYKEHAIGEGREVKAATYIECTASGSHEKVWGVGIHEDVVQASLIALLSAASSFLTSRVSTPVPFRPKHTPHFSDAELQALERLNLNASDTPSSPLRSSMTADSVPAPSKLNMEPNAGSVSANRIDIDLLERKAEDINGQSQKS
ncbi:2-isopropylmalate synthase [Capronia coronata CBS 617.96]|uniref:2-isopropylmalate synthase n=1 Tax=Capronia coronata CBS 617.96 TaxID=1182541 RepID=W9XZ50_9EURO|nr:2-isopropylmalate synthase [Capronia coronata CBS 617.96]EXJ85498.1 2-isopropylmalate synthase [Capronia coronata CBS 617.96]